ncbi:hypothetical protein G6F40_016838 [Rhizopus arrhizus]|nr:hypothetical protein G6F40_016838 [Rhizopus arrhizus]
MFAARAVLVHVARGGQRVRRQGAERIVGRFVGLGIELLADPADFGPAQRGGALRAAVADQHRALPNGAAVGFPGGFQRGARIDVQRCA